MPLLLSFHSSFIAYQLARPDTLFNRIGTSNDRKATSDPNFWWAFGRKVMLLTIPQDPLDAAKVDGCTPWQSFRYMTLPFLIPFISTAMAIRLLDVARTGLILTHVARNVPSTTWPVNGFFRRVPKERAEAAD